MFAANEALQQGRGGISQVSRVCGLSRVTITKGTREIDGEPLPAGRIRRPGGGRPRHEARDPALPGVLESLVEPLARDFTRSGEARERLVLPEQLEALEEAR